MNAEHIESVQFVETTITADAVALMIFPDAPPETTGDGDDRRIKRILP